MHNNPDSKQITLGYLFSYLMLLVTLPTEMSLVIVLVQYNSTTLASVSLCIPKIQVKILCAHLLNHNKQLEALLAISDLPVSTSNSSRGHAKLTHALQPLKAQRIKKRW